MWKLGAVPRLSPRNSAFLRQFIPAQPYRGDWHDRTLSPDIHVTYHAGEDFLDLVDGLRAIDEAVRFLALQRGDRIGHGLALGVEPAIHYRFKGRNIVLPKQVRLDDLVWVLYRGSELLDQFERGEFEPLPPQGLMEELYSILAAVELPEDHPCIFRSNHVLIMFSWQGRCRKTRERLLGEIAWSASELGKIKDWDVYNNTRY